MTVPANEWSAFHVGFVVRDVEAVTDRYQRLLRVSRWFIREAEMPAWSLDAAATDVRVRTAWGRGSGITYELIQVLAGTTMHSRFLDEHGEGVQHLGFWVPDVAEAVASATAEGATVSLALSQGRTVSVQLSGSVPADALPGAAAPLTLAMVDPGASGVQIELVGPGGHEGLRQRFGDAFADVIVSPPWLQG